MKTTRKDLMAARQALMLAETESPERVVANAIAQARAEGAAAVLREPDMRRVIDDAIRVALTSVAVQLHPTDPVRSAMHNVIHRLEASG